VIDVADRLEIHELLGLYGHLIDDRRWDDLDQVFTPDAIYDATDFGQSVTHSLAELLAHWKSDLRMHPLAHHATNIVVSEDADGTVRVRSKGIGVGPRGRVGSVTYDDILVRTDGGWRMSYRRAVLRRADDT
jgi:SnoaL-like domain